MEISKETKRHLMEILAFGILLYAAVEHLDVVLGVIRFFLAAALPFVVGAAIAFILNVPMKKLEPHLFKKNGKLARFRRPVAYVLTVVIVVGVIVLAMIVVIPELGSTVAMIIDQIPVAIRVLQGWFAQISEKWPALEPAIAEMDIDWSSISKSAVGFVKSMASGLFSSGMGMFSGIVSGVTTFVIGFTFSIYVIFQKEKLASQAKQVMYALLPESVTKKALEVAQLSGQVFSSFLSGQCVEAVILGTMFVVAMTILRMPYAMLIGIVIAITALIPVFGAFIGCAVGVLLIVMVSPLQAIGFVILFFVLQQIEGNLIYPHVVGGSIGLPSIWVLVAVTLGGNLFGILGIILFIPLCSVLYALFRSFVKKRLADRGVEAEKYR